MGKNSRHSKDRLYITATEWSTNYGGKKVAANENTVRSLPFSHCALSLLPYETPVLLGRDNGVIFDHENIMSYLLKYKNDPVSGEERTIKDIIKLNMTKNTDDEWEW